MIDHLVYAVPDLQAGIEDIASRWGVQPVVGGKHAGRGTHNALLSFGDGSYLEIIAPDPEQQVAAEQMPFGLGSGVDAGLRTFAIKAPNIEERVAKAAAAGFDPGPALAMSRDLPGGAGTLRWKLTRQEQASYAGDGLIPFLIDWGDSAHPSETSPHGCRLLTLRAEHPDPEYIEVAYRVFELDIPVSAGPVAALIATVETPNGVKELR